MMVTEMVLEKNLMEEITDTMPTEGPSIEGSELLEVDEVETSDEEDDISSNTKEINESRPRVVVKRLLVIDLKDEENILDEKVKEMEVSETIGGEKTSAQENELQDLHRALTQVRTLVLMSPQTPRRSGSPAAIQPRPPHNPSWPAHVG